MSYGACCHTLVYFANGLVCTNCMAYITGWPESDALTDRLARKSLFAKSYENKRVVAIDYIIHSRMNKI